MRILRSLLLGPLAIFGAAEVNAETGLDIRFRLSDTGELLPRPRAPITPRLRFENALTPRDERVPARQELAPARVYRVDENRIGVTLPRDIAKAKQLLASVLADPSRLDGARDRTALVDACGAKEIGALDLVVLPRSLLAKSDVLRERFTRGDLPELSPVYQGGLYPRNTVTFSLWGSKEERAAALAKIEAYAAANKIVLEPKGLEDWRTLRLEARSTPLNPFDIVRDLHELGVKLDIAEVDAVHTIVR